MEVGPAIAKARYSDPAYEAAHQAILSETRNPQEMGLLANDAEWEGVAQAAALLQDAEERRETTEEVQEKAVH